MPWELQNWEKSGFYIPSHASFLGKLGKFRICQNDRAVFDTVLRHFRVHHLFDMSSPFGFFFFFKQLLP